MTYEEIKGDLFSVSNEYYLAHCISADYALGAGIAVQFNKRYKMKSKLNKIGYVGFPQTILIENVFNLITKERYFHKPTEQTLAAALTQMRDICIKKNITKLAMPKVGCGLDKLQWGRVSEIIKNLFKDTDIDIKIYYL